MRALRTQVCIAAPLYASAKGKALTLPSHASPYCVFLETSKAGHVGCESHSTSLTTAVFRDSCPAVLGQD